MADGPTYRRTQFLVDRAYQLRFVARMVVAIFIIAFLSSLVAMFILWSNMYRPELGKQTHIAAACIGIGVALFVEVLVSIPIVYLLGIRMSHRVVGPMARITRALDAIGNGDFSPRLVLREGDVLEDLAKTINKMAENLQQRYGGSTPPKS